MCQKTRLPVIFELLSSNGFRARRRRDFLFSGCACHGVGNPSTALHHHKSAKLTCSQLLSMPDVEKSQHFYRGRSQNCKTSKFAILTPMRARAGISTSDIHFIISKPVSAVRADVTEVPTSRHKSSSTNGLAATGPQSGSNFEKNFSETNFFRIHYDQKNTLNPLVKSVFKSVHKHRRYLHFCDRHVCSNQ